MDDAVNGDLRDLAAENQRDTPNSCLFNQVALRGLDQFGGFAGTRLKSLQLIDWVIGYLTATKKGRIAGSLSANRDHIRSNLLGRAPLSVPTTEAEVGQGSA